MNHLDLTRHILSISAGAALLAGCGGSQLPIGAPGAMPQSRAIVAHADRSGSWMLPEAKGEDLLYVANLGNKASANVTVYSYPQGKLVGTLTGFDEPEGLCVDKAANVFVTDLGDETITEYAHGGKSPVQTLIDNGSPQGCAIDPTTHNLAVTNSCDGPNGYCFPSGTVLIYKKASGVPEQFTDSYTVQMFYCAYDRGGNLFVDGINEFYDVGFAELPKGSTIFKEITLTLPKHPQAPGGLQWHDKYLAAAAFDGNVVYQYSLDGSEARRVHSTPLRGVRPGDLTGVIDFSIQNKTLVAPISSLRVHTDRFGAVELFKYPQGGEPTESISKSVAFPTAAAVSLAPH